MGSGGQLLGISECRVKKGVCGHVRDEELLKDLTQWEDLRKAGF